MSHRIYLVLGLGCSNLIDAKYFSEEIKQRIGGHTNILIVVLCSETDTHHTDTHHENDGYYTDIDEASHLDKRSSISGFTTGFANNTFAIGKMLGRVANIAKIVIPRRIR